MVVVRRVLAVDVEEARPLRDEEEVRRREDRRAVLATRRVGLRQALATQLLEFARLLTPLAAPHRSGALDHLQQIARGVTEQKICFFFAKHAPEIAEVLEHTTQEPYLRIGFEWLSRFGRFGCFGLRWLLEALVPAV